MTHMIRCDGYNSALAAGVLLAVIFATSFVLDVMDMRGLSHDSRQLVRDEIS